MKKAVKKLEIEKPEPDPLNSRERRFVDAYVIDPRARRAALTAGYEPHRAVYAAKQLLAKPKILAEIQESRAELAMQFEVTKERIISELSYIAFARMTDFTRLVGSDRVVDLSMATSEQMAAVSEITSEVYTEGGEDGEQVKKTKIKLASKREALVDLGKTLGLWDTKDDAEVKVTITGGLPRTNRTPDATS